MNWTEFIMLFVLIVVIAICGFVIMASMYDINYPNITGGKQINKKPKIKPLIKEPRDDLTIKGILKQKDLLRYPRSKSEAMVINFLESATGEKFPTVYPSWLVWKGNTLELDGYNEHLNVAMEFSGPQHTKWAPSVESYEKYFGRIVRDLVKVRTCKQRGVKFFTVDVSLPSRHWQAYTMSRLYDLGVAINGSILKPPDYIPEQIVKPYRNKQIEKELGLDAEWKMATRLI